MRLQIIATGPGREPTVIDEVPWHDEASNGGSYRERLKLYLGGYFEQDEKGMQPKSELRADLTKPVPSELRLLDDGGTVIETYTTADLSRDTGMRITSPTQADLDAEQRA